MSIGDGLRSLGKSIVQKTETYIVPVKLQQLYKGYTLRDVALAKTGMPMDFLVTVAELADAIYLTGTKRGQSRNDSPQAHSLSTQLGTMFQNYMQVDRFDARTGLVFETNGPFGAVVACAVPPGQERVPVTRAFNPEEARYRLFILFRGTSVKLKEGYLDDVSTDLKAAAPKSDCAVGDRAGEVARGFQNTYLSCRKNVMDHLLQRGLDYLRTCYRSCSDAYSEAQGSSNGSAPLNLPNSRIEVYVVGHSLGGAVATLCAYDIACLRPSLMPVLVTFGSPTVGNIDFAIDFQRVMVSRNEYHPFTRYLRSARLVAQIPDKAIDGVSGIPSHLPNYIHVNTRVLVPSSASGRFGAHSMTTSYTAGLRAYEEAQ
jgi:Lipase (class 3)